MSILPLVLKIFALVFFVIAAWWAPAPTPDVWHHRLIAAGLAAWVLSDIVAGIGVR